MFKRFDVLKRFNFLLSGMLIFAGLLIAFSFHAVTGVVYDIIRTIFTSFMVLFSLDGISRLNLMQHLKVLNGHWEGFQIGIPDVLDSKAKIVYKGDNLLRISATQTDGKRWNGIIEINERVLNKHGIRGTLVYKYEGTEEAGYREVLILKEAHNDYMIYTFPTTSIDVTIHGKCVFKRAR